MIKLINLGKAYGGNTVLRDINVTLEAGKAIGIVGENGAGKTTLFNCLAGLTAHTGSIESEYNNLQSVTGFLTTNPFFLPMMTGLEYLKLICRGLKIENADFEKANIFNLPLKKYASSYSTGMKKKLALTGILLHPRQLYIFDEPFNGVDIQSSIMITEIIKRIKESGKTLLISSHIFSTLEETCDEIMVLKNQKFAKTVMPKDYSSLSIEMKAETIGKKLDGLNL
jgi:ABC-2 type transport system ATP-binding protein